MVKRPEERAKRGLLEEEETEKTKMAQRDGLDGVLITILARKYLFLAVEKGIGASTTEQFVSWVPWI